MVAILDVSILDDSSYLSWFNCLQVKCNKWKVNDEDKYYLIEDKSFNGHYPGKLKKIESDKAQWRLIPWILTKSMGPFLC
jgi:hypothetical protein